MDYITLPLSNGKRYALTIVDSFTRFFTVYPLRNNRACDTAKCLVDYVTKHGKIPSTISTDRGTHFLGQVLNNLCKALNIKQNLHCAWRPQSSGILERHHRTLKTSLYIVAKELNSTWPEVLTQVVAAMNAGENRATKCSPFFAMFGRPWNIGLPKNPNVVTNVDSALTHGMSINHNLAKIHNLVRMCSKEADEKMDSKANPFIGQKLVIGEKVLVHRLSLIHI